MLGNWSQEHHASTQRAKEANRSNQPIQTGPSPLGRSPNLGARPNGVGARTNRGTALSGAPPQLWRGPNSGWVDFCLALLPRDVCFNCFKGFLGLTKFP